MAKILLVEDDKSLREIYGVRLQAEGYDIVSAGDGEEALAMAIKEKPDLIVSDVMMPKISGFDMLDILRSTTETKNVKIIMMTALSSDDQRARGEALGADRYLVKSQVGIEDVVRTVHDVLSDAPGSAAAAPAPTLFEAPEASEPPVADVPAPAAEPIDLSSLTATQPPADPSVPVADPTPLVAPIDPAPAFVGPVTSEPPVPPIAPTPEPVAPVAPVPVPVANVGGPVINMAPEVPPASPVVSPAPAPMPVPSVSPAPVAPTPEPVAPVAPVPAPEPASSPLPAPTAPFSSPAPASLGDRIISPISPQDENVQRPPNLSELMNQELQNADAAPTPPVPPAPTP